MSDKDHEIPVKVIDRRWWARGADGDAPSDERATTKPSYVEQLERQLAEKDRQLQDAIARYRQAAAEFEQSRLRQRREISKEIERGRREFLSDLLEVVDNLDRALDAARTSPSPEALLQGVEMVRRQFLAKLEGLGVRRIEAEGHPFDPLLHEAVSTVPSPTPDHDGLVVGIVRHGYTIGDDILRPAAVAVAQQETSTSER
jgi:molecular chaperone GrpE